MNPLSSQTHIKKKTGSFITKVEAYCKKHPLLKQQNTIIIGLSGGPDSVCLTSVLKKLQPSYELTLIAVHIDHEWRSNSADDAQFCKEFAQSLSLPFHCIKASEIAISKKYNGSQEEMGRFLRRQALESIAKQYNADAIALAHHADDQQETFFLRMIRGASIAGLSAMQPKEGIYIRPLLEVHKQEILRYLTDHQLPYVTDSTNESDQFLRNSLRLQVLPALKQCDPRFDKNFFKTHTHIQETNAFLERITQKRFQEICTEKDGVYSLNYEQLLATDSFLHHPLLLTWLCHMRVPFTPSTAFFDEMVRFLRNSAKSHRLNDGWIIERDRSVVCIKQEGL